MRKHRLEIAIISFFAILVIALLWKVLSIPSVPFLPWILLGVVGAVLLATVVDALAVRPTGSEKYAPIHFAKVFVSSIVGIAFMIGVATVLHRPNFSKSFDFSEGKIHSLSPETTKFLKEGLKQEVQIVCVPDANPRDTYCQENAHLRGLYTQANPGRVQTFNLSLGDRQMLQVVNPTGFSRLVLLTKDGKRKEIEGQIDESKLTNGLFNLFNRDKVVYFLTGFGEPSVNGADERSYSALVEVLKARGYDAKEIDPGKEQLPENAEVVIAGSNTIPYPPMVEDALRKHIARGGRLIVSTYPFRALGLTNLLGELGVTLEDKLLVGNEGATPFGQRYQQIDPLRPPISVGQFSRLSDITSEFPVNARLPISGAVPLKVVDKTEGEVKVRSTKLMEAFDAAPVSLTPTERNQLPEKGALGVSPEPNYNTEATYPVAYELTVEGFKNLDKTAEPKKDAKDEAKSNDTKVIVLGFDMAASRFLMPASMGIEVQLPVLAVAAMYQDKALISIPTKDYKPKAFRMDRDPNKYLLLFSFLLPVLTVVAGAYIWSRRRLA